MPGTGDALRRTSDSLLRDIEALLELEEEKRTIEPGDPRLVELASQIEQIAKRVLASSTSERAQTQLIHALTEAGSPAAPDGPIEDTPRSMEAILAAGARRSVSSTPRSPALPRPRRRRFSSLGYATSTGAHTTRRTGATDRCRVPAGPGGGIPGRIRTCDLPLRRRLLCPLSYGDSAGW